MKNIGRTSVAAALAAAAVACGDAVQAPDAGAEDSGDASVDAPDSGAAHDAAPPADAAPPDDADPIGPDIVVTDAVLDTSTVIVNEDATVTATVKNEGDETGTKTLEFLVDGQVERTREVTVDAPGEVEEEFVFSSDVPDDYELAVNSVIAGTLTVEDAPEADIVVASADADPSEIVLGEETTVTATAVNQGDATGSKVLDFRVDGAVEDSEEVNLLPGGQETVTFDFAPEVLGNRTFELSVDDTSAGTLTVSPAPLVGYRVEPEEHEVPSEGFVELSATCNAPRVVLGGGLFAEEEGTLTLHFSYPAFDPGPREHSWVVGVSNRGDRPVPVEVRAICAERPPGYHQEPEPLELGGAEFAREVAACRDDGSVPLGGGFKAESVDVRLQHLGPELADTIGWFVGASNDGGGAEKAEVVAICAQKPAGYEVVDHSRTIDPGEELFSGAECGEHVVLGGGVSVDEVGDAEPGTRIRISSMFRAPPNALMWATALTNQSPDPLDLTFLATCAPRG